jgi:hypothetical protein
VPDLTIEYKQVCRQTELAENVLSSKGDKTYSVLATLEGGYHDSCTCPGFGFRGKCRHIEEVRSRICGWHELHSDEIQTPQQEMEGICPKCGGETLVKKVAV